MNCPQAIRLGIISAQHNIIEYIPPFCIYHDVFYVFEYLVFHIFDYLKKSV